MALQALKTQRFTRKTELGPNERHRAFYKLDNDITDALTSPAADEVTPLMSKIYLRLTRAPAQYWERPGVLHIRAEEFDGKWFNAWQVLLKITGVASATAKKAFDWLHGQGIIGYTARKNGVGIRIFLNHATNSIGRVDLPVTPKTALPVAKAPQTASAGQKILYFPHTSPNATHTSPNEVPFNCDGLERNLDVNEIPPANATQDVVKLAQYPPHGENHISENKFINFSQVTKEVSQHEDHITTTLATAAEAEGSHSASNSQCLQLEQLKTQGYIMPTLLEHISAMITKDLAQTLAIVTEQNAAQMASNVVRQSMQNITQAAQQAAGEAVKREMAVTRDWFENKALPKAVRVAQHEGYKILRQAGERKEQDERVKVALEVGKLTNSTNEETAIQLRPALKSTAELHELADLCCVRLEFCQESITQTIASMSIEAGGDLLPEDAHRVRKLAEEKLQLNRSVIALS